MKNTRPDTSAILDGLKDFQRATVEHVFRRLYLDEDCTRRFLVADEVGLGKTLVARGVIAKTIDHLWDRTKRIDILYVCSNADIARQNIKRMSLPGCKQFSLASRITLLPLHLAKLQESTQQNVNFVSFTPATSFDLKDSTGVSQERELLYAMIEQAWQPNFNQATRVMSAYAKAKGFRERVQSFPVGDLNPEITKEFVQKLQTDSGLQSRFLTLCEEMPRAGAVVPDELARRRNAFIGDLRRILAEICLYALEPDLIILDEFQRFKQLLQGESEEASEAAQLAKHLFEFQSRSDDPATAARVLLLSATPYKMYTRHHENEQDDHYRDFLTTVDFLMQDNSDRVAFRQQIKTFRGELFRAAEGQTEGIVEAKQGLEACLRKVMVRTERLSLSADRNGMLKEVKSANVSLKAADLRQYLGLQQVAEQLEQGDMLEFWKSAPYLLNFMDDYEFKRHFKRKVEKESTPEFVNAVRAAAPGLLNRDDIERYQKIDPSNARMRALCDDTIGQNAWRLLWMPSSLPYYQGAGSYSDPDLAQFTKRLVFSCWRVVPRAIASVLSYEAERSMMRRLRTKRPYSAERRSGQLRFYYNKGRPAGMAVLGMVYPSQTLATHCDPLQLTQIRAEAGSLTSIDELLRLTKSILAPLLDPVLKQYSSSDTRTDDHWYGIAPLLLDVEHDSDSNERWRNQESLAEKWRGNNGETDAKSVTGWERHVQFTLDVIDGKEKLGRPPEDLIDVLAMMAIAGPGTASLRALQRILPDSYDDDCDDCDDRAAAGPLAHAFLHLFNLPEVYCLLRDSNKSIPYWRSVLMYCLAGNLQSVLDEYSHILVESLGVRGNSRQEIANGVSEAIARSLTLRTATTKADVISTTRRTVRIDEPIRFRTRFAMRFGDQEADDNGVQTRADQVRSAFNSPFWPFVLATTSVGQEGLDFHNYCHAVVHWNLPSNPVDLEQREGRIHRYKGHALRKNIASEFRNACKTLHKDPWESMFQTARDSRTEGQNDLFPFWITPFGDAKIQRHVPSLPLSRDTIQYADLLKTLVLYRMVFGQNRQEDLVQYLLTRLPQAEVERIAELCRVDLSPV